MGRDHHLFDVGPHPRRQFLRRGSALAALAAMPGVLAACGSDDEPAASGKSSSAPGAVAGTITMVNYEGWIGKTQVADFKKRFPDADVKQVYGINLDSPTTIQQIKQDPGQWDLALMGTLPGGQLTEAKALSEFDPERVPNLKHMPELAKTSFPWGIPVDYGRTAYGYRSDIVSEKPESWADLWELAPKYSKKIVMLNEDTHVFGAALKLLGYSGTSTKENELKEALARLKEIKPHVRAMLDTDSAKPLIDGSAAFALTYDYEVANAQKSQKNIVWVEPKEGTRAYMDGWAPLVGTKKMDAIYAFMNHMLEPRIYADFVNTTGTAYFMKAANPYIKDEIKNNPALAYNEETVSKLDIPKWGDPGGTKLRDRYWQEFLAS
ncbi:ABC transporter substrate-binding protein [Patulibacter defluvii]|uniref:ABC transporter substrate-binding protein n=1 Tax=Patulibacter defluvii TaxID=3095358 RepID=UPI002A75F969|nr:extracellular solute-binding protein [Patulibacter sp. DM4]